MLKVEAQHAQYQGLGAFRAHHFNYGSPGEQPQGIWQRIRGGGNTTVEVGADVMGHEHVHKAFKDKIQIGGTIETVLPDGRQATVRLQAVKGIWWFDSPDMIRQDGEDEWGYEFIGTVTALGEPEPQRLKKTGR